MSRPKIALTVTTLIVLVVSGLAVPLPLHVKAMFLIEPHDVRHVYTLAAGRLDTRPSQPGDQVKAGQTLAQLNQPAFELEQLRLEQEEQVQMVRVSVASALDDRSQEELARARRRTIRGQRDEFQKQVEQLAVLAPCDGIVVAPSRVPAPRKNSARYQLPTWDGTPLETRNQHCFLTERTHLLSIAPDRDFQAIMLVDQGDRNDLVSAEEALGFSGNASAEGLVVTSVLPDSVAARAGISQGDRITAVNGQPVIRLANLVLDDSTTTLELAITPDDGSEQRSLSLVPAAVVTRVQLKFDHLPHRVYEGFVEKISRRDLEFVPELLSNKLGGEIPTVSDAQGRERLVSPAYQATVLLTEDAPLLKTGLRGRSRFLVDTRTAGQWLYRWWRRTFKFRI